MTWERRRTHWCAMPERPPRERWWKPRPPLDVSIGDTWRCECGQLWEWTGNWADGPYWRDVPR